MADYNPSKRLVKNRADISQFLIHLTKKGSYKHFLSSRRGGYYFTTRMVDAEGSLRDILSSRCLEARSPCGYYQLKVPYPSKPRGKVDPSWLKCVCFSEAPLREVKSFYQTVSSKSNKYQKFGLAFWSDRIREKGGNPIFYIDSRNSELLLALDQIEVENPDLRPLLPLIETFGPLVSGGEGFSDFRWEREWRKPGNLNFENSDVAFGVCDQSQTLEFEALVGRAFPFIDPEWTDEALREYLGSFGAMNVLEAL